MNIQKSKTPRNFKLIEFRDYYENECSIQESSLAIEEAIWIGVDDANPQILESKIKEGGTGYVKYIVPEDVHFTTRMHLTREQVKEILPFLKKFVKEGEIY